MVLSRSINETVPWHKPLTGLVLASASQRQSPALRTTVDVQVQSEALLPQGEQGFRANCEPLVAFAQEEPAEDIRAEIRRQLPPDGEVTGHQGQQLGHLPVEVAG